MKIKIGNKKIGENEPCFIVAEAGINHNGNINIAKKMIEIAKACGVDAIKFQTFKVKEFVRDENEEYEYETQGKKVKESMLKMFERYEFKKQEWKEIADYCKEKEIIFFSTPQNPSDLNLLLELNVPVLKVGSDDLINIPLLEEYSRKQLPMIISSGMAYSSEINEAVKTILKNNKELALLHCVSSYPAADYEMNLKKILTLQKTYPNCIIGFSDHSFGCLSAFSAVTLSAKIIEKHFTLDRKMYGPDHKFSADPKELKELVKGIRYIEVALGSSELKPTAKEKEMRKLCHRSIIALKDIKMDEILTKKNISIKRPGTGLAPKFINDILGKKAKKYIKKNELINLEEVY